MAASCCTGCAAGIDDASDGIVAVDDAAGIILVDVAAGIDVVVAASCGGIDDIIAADALLDSSVVVVFCCG